MFVFFLRPRAAAPLNTAFLWPIACRVAPWQSALVRRIAVAQRLLRAFAVGDVAGDLGDADDPPVLAQDRRNGQRDVDELAILSSSDRFKMVDVLTTLQPPEE